MNTQREPERIQTVVIGGGQAGLSVGYHLARRGLPFVILDANERTGDAWRERWDSLRLFSPARYNGLDGMPFPAKPSTFPTKDEMGDYLEAYASHFDLPIRRSVRVDRLSRQGPGFLVETRQGTIEADNVIVAIGHYQQPRVPAFAADLAPTITQLHSIDYRSPSQLRPGGVLLVGAGNSGAEIAVDVVRSGHETFVSGKSPGQIPFRPDGLFGRTIGVRLVLGLMFRHVLTLRTPMGRKMRPKELTHAGPLIRTRTKDLDRAGVHRVGRTAGVRDGRPVLDDGTALDVANVIWCTGFDAGYESWIDMPVFGEFEPLHKRGVVGSMPGLYFVGLPFQYSMASVMVQGVGRDADYVVQALAARVSEQASGEPVGAGAVMATS